jgi:Tfp pilus assembly protein PilX
MMNKKKIIEWIVYIILMVLVTILGLQGVKYINEQEYKQFINNDKQIENFNYNYRK